MEIKRRHESAAATSTREPRPVALYEREDVYTTFLDYPNESEVEKKGGKERDRIIVMMLYLSASDVLVEPPAPAATDVVEATTAAAVVLVL